MTILVIGNGFDLAHGLPTQYAQFLDFLRLYIASDEELEKATRRMQYSEVANFAKRLRCSDNTANREVHDLLSHTNSLLTHFHSVCEQRRNEGKEGWVDFEAEIAWMIQLFEQAREEARLGKQYLSSDLKEKIAPFICSSNAEFYPPENIIVYPELIEAMSRYRLGDLNIITRLLEIYLVEFIDQLYVDPLPQISNLPNITHVLSFNYTSTYQRLYGNDNVEYCYIHGKANEHSSIDNCNMVLGIDEYLKGDARDLDNTFIWFKKFYQRIYKETSSSYIDWLNKHEQTCQALRKTRPPQLDIYFYGHSLDITDKDVLEKLILHENAKIHIFYRDKGSMAKQISNLVKIIGEDNLIKMTRGSNCSLVFEPVKNS